MSKTVKALLLVVAFIALAAGMVLIEDYFRAKFKPQEPNVEIHTDTLYIERIDTVLLPVEIWREIVRTDTVLLTTIKHDTVLVELPIEQRFYHKDSVADIWISGYNPKLDSLRIYREREIRYQTITYKEKSRWGIGIQAGVGISAAGMQPTPYLGLGISYNIFSW